MEIIKNVGRWGNSAGILLPKELIGQQVKIILIDRTLEIKREVFDILEKYMENIIGIYLVGSYARNEQEEDSDIDIIAVSKDIKKEIISGKYNISITPLENLKKTIEKNPILIVPRLNEAKSLVNSSLLEELKSIRLDKSKFRDYFQETENIIKINRKLIEIDKEQKREYLDSISIIYSLILRLRGIFLIKNIINKEKYSKKEFFKWVNKEIDQEEFQKAYKVYKSIRDNKKIKERIKIETGEKLLNILEKEEKKIK